jgi:alanine dehydrogenase
MILLRDALLTLQPLQRRFLSKKVGILRETKNRWECRVPLAPENIKKLKQKWKDQLEFHVQPSNKRVFPDDKYVQVNKQ